MILNILLVIIILSINIYFFVTKVFTVDLSYINQYYAPHPNFKRKSTEEDIKNHKKYSDIVTNAILIPYAIIIAINFISIFVIIFLNYAILGVTATGTEVNFEYQFFTIVFLVIIHTLYERKRWKVVNLKDTLIFKAYGETKYGAIWLYWFINTMLIMNITFFFTIV